MVLVFCAGVYDEWKKCKQNIWKQIIHNNAMQIERKEWSNDSMQLNALVKFLLNEE